jgi:hypothetical protein
MLELIRPGVRKDSSKEMQTEAVKQTKDEDRAVNSAGK